MVTLRERKTRPSYALVENIFIGSDESGSDGDGGGDGVAGPGPSTSSNRNNRRSKGGRTVGAADGEDDSSFSSAGTDEFRPSPPKTNEPVDEEGAEKAEEETFDEVFENDVDSEGDDIDVFMDEDDVPTRKKPRVKSIAGRASKGKLGSKSRGITKRNTTPKAKPEPTVITTPQPRLPKEEPIPSSYADLIRNSLESISKSRQTNGQRPAGMEVGGVAVKFGIHATAGIEALPPGSPVPYSLRLKKTPARGSAPVEVICLVQPHREGVEEKQNRGDKEDRELRESQRKTRAWNIAKQLDGGPNPWQVWEGEGWWPEMKQKTGNVGHDAVVSDKGRSKGQEISENKAEDVSGVKQEPLGWIRREQVRLGLDDVGRYSALSIVIPEVEGQAYLPIGRDQLGRPGIRLHLGPLGNQTMYHVKTFDTLQDKDSASKGHLFSVGGPIWGLDWAPYPDQLSSEFGFEQYLAVAPLPSLDTPAFIGAKSSPSPACIQIWAVIPSQSAGASVEQTANGEVRCEIVLCIDGAGVMQLKWMPLGAWDHRSNEENLPKLGIIATVQLDGSVSLYAVPHPRSLRTALKCNDNKPIYIRGKALLRLEVNDAAAMCIDWISGSRLAVGFSNGHVAIYDVTSALIATKNTATPSAYIQLAFTCIRSITACRYTADEDYTADTPYICAAAFDGSTLMVDLRDPTEVLEINKARVPSLVTAWSYQSAAPIFVDVEYDLTMARIRLGLGPRSFRMISHRGPVWDIATSEYHPMVVTACSDGSVMLMHNYTGTWRRKKVGYVYQRLYEVDYDSVAGEYRILDTFGPIHSDDKTKVTYTPPATTSIGGGDEDMSTTNQSAYPTGQPNMVKTGTWAPQVGIHRAAWQSGSGIGRAGWLATGGAAGLVRVEWVEGRFRNNTKPQEL